MDKLTRAMPGFFDEMTQLSKKVATYKVKSNGRMMPPTKGNIEALQGHIEQWDDPHREEANKFLSEVSPEKAFELLHSIRRWYAGQTMAHKLKQYNPVLASAMQLDPESVVGVYRGFKVPNNSPLAAVKEGDLLTLDVTRNRGLSSWATSQEATNRFSGKSKGKTGLIVRLANSEGVQPLLAPPSHTAPWFNALYERAIGKSFRPTEEEYLIAAPRVQVEVVRVKR